MNRDPIGEVGGVNLFSNSAGDLVNSFDVLGLQARPALRPTPQPSNTQRRRNDRYVYEYELTPAARSVMFHSPPESYAGKTGGFVSDLNNLSGCGMGSPDWLPSQHRRAAKIAAAGRAAHLRSLSPPPPRVPELESAPAASFDSRTEVANVFVQYPALSWEHDMEPVPLVLPSPMPEVVQRDYVNNTVTIKHPNGAFETLDMDYADHLYGLGLSDDPSYCSSRQETFKAFHGADGDEILSILEAGALRPRNGLIFLSEISDTFAHGADLKRKASFTLELDIKINPDKVTPKSVPGNPRTLEVATDQDVLVEIHKIHIRRPDGSGGFTYETIGDVNAIRSMLEGSQ